MECLWGIPGSISPSKSDRNGVVAITASNVQMVTSKTRIDTFNPSNMNELEIYELFRRSLTISHKYVSRYQHFLSTWYAAHIFCCWLRSGLFEYCFSISTNCNPNIFIIANNWTPPKRLPSTATPRVKWTALKLKIMCLHYFCRFNQI